MENSETKNQENRIKLPPGIVFDFRSWMQDNNYAYGTIRIYCKFLLRLLHSDKAKNIISKEKINSFIVKHNTIYNQCAIRKFLDYLEFEKDIKLDRINFPRLRKERKEVYPISREDIQLVINALPDDDDLFKFKLLTEMLSRTGMRISEGIGLKIENIDFFEWTKDRSKYGKIILVETKGNVMRTLFIKPDLMEKLAEQCKDKDMPGESRKRKEYVFDFNHKRWQHLFLRKNRKLERAGVGFYDEDLKDLKYIEKSSAYYRKIIRRISEKVLSKPIHSHIFRHSFLTYLDSLNVKPHLIQRVAGHKSLNTTSSYLHPTDKEMSVTAI